ncbi:hypothetical protein ACS0TY_007033 [Phlomoides rotata]
MNLNHVDSSQPNSSQDFSDDEYSLEENLIAQQIYNNNYAHPTHGGLVPGHKTINRDREAAHDTSPIQRLFSKNPTFNARMFRIRF